MAKKQIKKKQKAGKSASKQHNPHDKFFKKVFRNKKYLLELLKVIFSDKVFALFDSHDMVIKDSMLFRMAGGELRTDLTVTLRLKGIKDYRILLTLILEHKSYKDRNAVMQTMEYFVRMCRERRKQHSKGAAHHLIIPVVLLCCEDKDFEPPTDYLAWEFGAEEIPSELRALASDLPILACKVVNLRKLPSGRLWTKAACSGIAIHGMGEVWDVDEDTIAFLIEKFDHVSPEDTMLLSNLLTGYYEDAETGYGRKDFDRVDRERRPHLREEERLMAMTEYAIERAERLGIKKGMQLGKQEGMQLGKQEGMQLGKQEGMQLGKQEGMQLGKQEGRQLGKQEGMQQGIEQRQAEIAARMLARGTSAAEICELLQLTKQELAALKKKLGV